MSMGGQRWVRPIAAGVFVTSLWFAGSARAEALEYYDATTNNCVTFDTVTATQGKYAGQCKLPQPTAVKNVRDLAQSSKTAWTVTDSEVVGGAYVGLIDLSVAATRITPIQIYQFGSGGAFLVVGKLSTNISGVVSPEGYKKFARLQDTWKFERSAFSFRWLEDPIYGFMQSLDEPSIAQVIDAAIYQRLALAKQYIMGYLQSGVLEPDDNVKVNLNHTALFQQLAHTDTVALFARLTTVFDRSQNMLQPNAAPGFLPSTSAQLAAALQQNAICSGKVDSLATDLKDATAKLEDANNQIAVLKSDNQSVTEKLAIADKEVSLLHASYTDLAIQLNYPYWGKDGPSYVDTNDQGTGLAQWIPKAAAGLQTDIESWQVKYFEADKLAAQLTRDLEASKQTLERTIKTYEEKLETTIKTYEEELAETVEMYKQLLEQAAIEAEAKLSMLVQVYEKQLLELKLQLEKGQVDLANTREMLAKTQVALEESNKELEAAKAARDAYVAATATYTKSLYERLRLPECGSGGGDVLGDYVAEPFDDIVQPTAATCREDEMRAMIATAIEELQGNLAERDAYVAATATYTKSLYERVMGKPCEVPREDDGGVIKEEDSKRVARQSDARSALEENGAPLEDALGLEEEALEQVAANTEVAATCGIERMVDDIIAKLGERELELERYQVRIAEIGKVFDVACDADQEKRQQHAKDDSFIELKEDVAPMVEQLDTLAGTCNYDQLQTQIIAAASALSATIREDKEKIEALVADLFEARREPTWRVVDMVQRSAVSGELIDARYLEGSNLDAVRNNLSEQIVGAKNAFSCGKAAAIPADSRAHLEDVLDAAAKRLDLAGGAVCGGDAAEQVAGAVRGIGFVRNLLGAITSPSGPTASPNAIYAACSIVYGGGMPDSCTCWEGDPATNVSNGAACFAAVPIENIILY